MHIRLTTVQLTLAFLFATSASQAQVNVVKVDSTSQKKEAMQFEMKDGKMVNIADSLAKSLQFFSNARFSEAVAGWNLARDS